MKDLVDTTEMYLRTIYELEEEGVPPLRARIAERLEQSGPTVSQTVSRMERDGLLTVTSNRTLQLSQSGRDIAIAVMRKHRLAERLLVDLIGLEWDQVHAEACRWEHVMSEAVEEKLIQVLDNPTMSPYGNPIPGLDKIGFTGTITEEKPEKRLSDLTSVTDTAVSIQGLGEVIQTDEHLVSQMKENGVVPHARVSARKDGNMFVISTAGHEDFSVDAEVATAIYIGQL